ncbi:unnamed protein product [Periconia digitata]|uniref:Rhodopsin domain-containing protein n=1 Tax=Periconia digitata TaxID=1303443 RepID=A0A9W4U071_9PLEO|nr:unnamed protein product [Periconia digitata]
MRGHRIGTRDPPPAQTLPYPGPDENRVVEIVVIYVIGTALGVLFMGLRLWSRIISKALGIDDWCMLAATILSIPNTCITIDFSVKGGTRHLYYLLEDPANAVYVVKWNVIARPMGYFALSIGKISIGFLLLRVLERTSRWRRWSIHITNIITAVNCVGVLITDFSQCRNPEALWDPSVKSHTKCVDPAPLTKFAMYASSWNTGIDFYFALLAMHLVWGLKLLDWRKKIAVSLFLGCGLITGIVSSIKTHALSLRRPDITWDYFWVYVWNGLEVTLLIVLGCLPTLRPLYRRLRGKKDPNDRTNGVYYTGSYGQPGKSTTRRSNQSYHPADSELNHPLVDLAIPEETHVDPRKDLR